jgi:hypothetical protein
MHSSSSIDTTSPSHNRTNAKACSYVEAWAKDPMTFALYTALVASAGSAANPQIRNEGKNLGAAIPTHSAEMIGNVLDQMVHSCIKVDLFKAPAAGTARQGS